MVILVFGLPGTGKTFFSEILAERKNAVHLNTDIIRGKLSLKGRYDEKTKQQVYNELFKKTQMELKKGANVIVDGTFHKSGWREQLEKLVAELHHKIYFIEIKASEETARKRLSKKRKHSVADIDVYKKINDKFESFNKDFLELWSDKEAIESMIKKAEDYISE